MSIWSYYETEQLIKFVENEHYIRIGNKQIHGSRIVITSWPEIAIVLNKSVKQCQDKWHRLKIHARHLSEQKCVCGYEPEINWKYYKLLTFLQPYFAKQRAKENEKGDALFQCDNCRKNKKLPLPPVQQLLDIQKQQRLAKQVGSCLNQIY